MNIYNVSFGSNIPGSHDHVYVMAKDEHEAFMIEKPKLGVHKLTPDFLNKYGRFHISKVENPQAILPFVKVYHK